MFLGIDFKKEIPHVGWNLDETFLLHWFRDTVVCLVFWWAGCHGFGLGLATLTCSAFFEAGQGSSFLDANGKHDFFDLSDLLASVLAFLTVSGIVAELNWLAVFLVLGVYVLIGGLLLAVNVYFKREIRWG